MPELHGNTTAVWPLSEAWILLTFDFGFFVAERNRL
jgi:hypothetical protein